MVDKRIFTIQINGIKESCQEIDTLLQKLNELQKSVNDLSKSGAKIKIGGTVTVKDDTKKPKDNTDKEVKETANTLAGLRKELGALKKELANTELGTQQWEELRDKVSSANTKVKEIEQSYGVFSRNVGNYTNSFLAAFNKFPQSVQNTLSGLHNFNQNASSLGQQIRTVSKSMEELTANGQQNSEAFEALKEVYSELVKAQLDLNDAIDDAKDRSNGLKDVTEVFESITGAMQLAAGAASLFGANSEDAVKAIQKMQALQSIANGLRTLQTSLQRNGALWKLWQKSLAITDRLLGTTNKTVKATDATLKSTNSTLKTTDASLKATAASSKATAAGMTATATATRGASVAMNGLRVAIASTGIGLLVVALGTLVSALMEFADSSEKANNSFEALADNIHNTYDNLMDDLAARRQLGLITELDEANTRLKEARKNVDEFGKLFEKTFNSTKNKHLSIFGNLYEGDDEAILRIRKVVSEINFYDKSIENTKVAIDKLNGVLNSVKFDNLEVPERVVNSVKAMIEAWEENRKAIENLDQIQQNNIDETKKAEEEKTKNTQEYADKRYRIEQTLAKNELALQANTLNTRLRALQIERDAEIREAKKSGILVQEQLASIEKIYQKNVSDTTREWENDFKKWLNKTADDYNSAVNNRLKSETSSLAQQISNLEYFYNYVNGNSFAKDEGGIGVSAMYDPNEEYPKLLEDEQRYLTTLAEIRKSVYDQLVSVKEEYIKKQEIQETYELTNSYNRQRSELELQIENERKRLEEEKNISEEERILRVDALESMEQELLNIEKEYKNKREEISTRYTVEQVKIRDDADNRLLASQRESQNQYLTSLTNWLNQIQEKLNYAQEENTNEWNIINLSAYRGKINEIKTETETLFKYLTEKKKAIKEAYDAADIDFQTYVDGIKQINQQIKENEKLLGDTNTMMKNSIGDFLESINVYVQQALQAYSQISSAIFDKIDADLEAQIESIDALNDKLQDVLDKQLDMIKKHNDKINEIEGELGSARGDRRDQLIAAFNAEQIARERSFAEQKKIEKEQEQLQKRKELLEKKQRANQHKQQLSQAIVSAALATTNAYATQPFVPVGLAMGSLAAALGAVQVGIIASTKYENGGELPNKMANGGVIQGKSHQQGGVPVLGFNKPIEVEGNEFITNKKTTMMNIELLEFINSKKKRIDLADLVSFYYDKPSGNGKPTQAKQKYADGGTLPVMNTIGLTNSTNRIVVDMDDKPIYVSVTEFERVQDNLHNVKAIAGY